MIAPARVAAYEILRAVNAGRADLPHALARARTHLPDERDRALAGEIATGTLRWQAACDRVISSFAGRPLSKLDPEVVAILRLTIFQLLHLDRVPASAAVNDAVGLTRRAGKRSAAPLVNAILRRVNRQRGDLPLPSRPSDPADRDAALDYLSVTLSHPRWLAARWVERYGFAAAETWERFNNSPAPLTLRANTLKTSAEELSKALRRHGVHTMPGKFAPDSLVVTEGNPLLTPLSPEGLFVVQDEASQLVPLMTGVKPGECVLDACASPGGKTTAMASMAAGPPPAQIVASDVRARRVDLLAQTVRMSSAMNVRIVRADADALPFNARFDCVLLDAPCSGLGTIRRDPDLRWRRTEADLLELAAIQLSMIRETARVLRPGGRLVYATCSSEPEENEEVIATFVAEGTCRPAEAPTLPEAMRPLVNRAGHLRTLPHRHGLEAFFAAVLVKN